MKKLATALLAGILGLLIAGTFAIWHFGKKDNITRDIAQAGSQKAISPESAKIQEKAPPADAPVIDINFTAWKDYSVPAQMKEVECSKNHNPVLQGSRIENEAAAKNLKCFSLSVNAKHTSQVMLYLFNGDLVAAQYWLRFSDNIEGVTPEGAIETTVTTADLLKIYSGKFGTKFKKRAWGDRLCVVGCLDFHFEEFVWKGGENRAALFEQQNLTGRQWITAIRYVSYYNASLRDQALSSIESLLKAQRAVRKKDGLAGDVP